MFAADPGSMENLTDFDRWCDLMDLDPEALRTAEPAPATDVA